MEGAHGALVGKRRPDTPNRRRDRVDRQLRKRDETGGEGFWSTSELGVPLHLSAFQVR